jgi:hypothetical protein
LHLASEAGQPGSVWALITAGADLQAKNMVSLKLQIYNCDFDLK